MYPPSPGEPSGLHLFIQNNLLLALESWLNYVTTRLGDGEGQTIKPFIYEFKMAYKIL